MSLSGTLFLGQQLRTIALAMSRLMIRLLIFLLSYTYEPPLFCDKYYSLIVF